MLWSVMRLIFKTSSVTPNFFYVFNIILSFSTYSQSFKKICTWELLGANVRNRFYSVWCETIWLVQGRPLGSERVKINTAFSIQTESFCILFHIPFHSLDTSSMRIYYQRTPAWVTLKHKNPNPETGVHNPQIKENKFFKYSKITL